MTQQSLISCSHRVLCQLGNSPGHLSFIWGLSNLSCFHWTALLSQDMAFKITGEEREREAEGSYIDLKCFGWEILPVVLLTIQWPSAYRLMTKNAWKSSKLCAYLVDNKCLWYRSLYSCFLNTVTATTINTNTTTNNKTIYLSQLKFVSVIYLYQGTNLSFY